jgi:hypothetical protein
VGQVRPDSLVLLRNEANAAHAVAWNGQVIDKLACAKTGRKTFKGHIWAIAFAFHCLWLITWMAHELYSAALNYKIFGRRRSVKWSEYNLSTINTSCANKWIYVWNRWVFSECQNEIGKRGTGQSSALCKGPKIRSYAIEPTRDPHFCRLNGQILSIRLPLSTVSSRLIYLTDFHRAHSCCCCCNALHSEAILRETS